jgi:hypothetical protein
MYTRTGLAAIVLAALFSSAFTRPARAHSVAVSATASRPSGDMTWGTFPIDGSQVRNNDLPGAPADGSTTTGASGTANFFYDRETDHLNYTVSWQNLSAPLLDVRIHGPATASQTIDDRLFDVLSDELAVVSAGVNRTTGSYSGTLDLQNPPDMSCGCGEFDPEEVAQTILNSLLQGHAYINLRTQAYTNGEIRGNFPVATAAADQPGPTPVPLPPAAWPAIATVAGFAAIHFARTRRRA